MLQDKPPSLPEAQPDGSPLKPITRILLDRRATVHFQPDAEVPPRILEAILTAGAQAPSGYNLQPWRFIVVRDRENRMRLQKVALDQPKVSEAPVVIVAVGMRRDVKRRLDEVFREGARRGVGEIEQVEDSERKALEFLTSMPMEVWLNRHVMIAVTAMMLVAEAYGFDTAPMEGFDPAGVKKELGIPDEGEVVSMLAIGRAKGPDKPHPGRFSLSRVTYAEKFGAPWGQTSAPTRAD